MMLLELFRTYHNNLSWDLDIEPTEILGNSGVLGIIHSFHMIDILNQNAYRGNQDHQTAGPPSSHEIASDELTINTLVILII